MVGNARSEDSEDSSLLDPVKDTEWGGESLVFNVGLSRCRSTRVQTPFCQQWLVHWPRARELEDTRLFWNNRALVFWSQPRHKLVREFASFLWVQVAHFFGHINERGEDFIMALLWSFFENTTGSTDLNRELLTAGVSNKLARLLLHILGCAGRLVHSLANLGTLTVAHLLDRCVALPHCLVEGLLLEGDGTGLLKGLLTHLLLGWSELGDIGVVALLSVLVGALQDRILLDGGHCLLLVDTAQSGVRILLTAAEVNSTRNDTALLPSPSSLLVVVAVAAKVDITDGKADDQ